VSGPGLKGHLGLQAIAIPSDGRDRDWRILEHEREACVVRLERAIDLHAIPPLCMSNVSDRGVVVLAPKERDGIETLAVAEDISSRRLSQTFGEHPMLDTNTLTAPRVGPARDVAGGKDARGVLIIVTGPS
jgi:hypothetical protein